MIRKIILIDEKKCNGCCLCVDACHEGAIGIVDGKAKLLKDEYCDGLGDCLPVCPTDAITFENRDTAAYDETAARNHMAQIQKASHHSGCPGARAREIHRETASSHHPVSGVSSELRQWPIQIQLAPVSATYFANAHLLIAADCVAYAYGNFHQQFMKNRAVLIGCPKLDAVHYSEKLTEILKQNNILSVTVVRMEMPCCGGIEQAAITALKNCNKMIPWQTMTITIDGNILDDTQGI